MSWNACSDEESAYNPTLSFVDCVEAVLIAGLERCHMVPVNEARLSEAVARPVNEFTGPKQIAEDPLFRWARAFYDYPNSQFLDSVGREQVSRGSRGRGGGRIGWSDDSPSPKDYLQVSERGQYSLGGRCSRNASQQPSPATTSSARLDHANRFAVGGGRCSQRRSQQPRTATTPPLGETVIHRPRVLRHGVVLPACRFLSFPDLNSPSVSPSIFEGEEWRLRARD